MVVGGQFLWEKDFNNVLLHGPYTTANPPEEAVLHKINTSRKGIMHRYITGAFSYLQDTLNIRL
jgi:hypothetical protein